MIEVQIKNQKAARITVRCLAISLVGLAALLCLRLVQWKDYVSVEATVAGIYTSEGTYAHPDDRHTEVIYTFRLNGQDFYASRTERFQSQSRVGEVRTIRYNPENPEMLEDAWARNGLLVLLCGGTAILVLLELGLRQAKSAAYRWPKEEARPDTRKYF